MQGGLVQAMLVLLVALAPLSIWIGHRAANRIGHPGFWRWMVAPVVLFFGLNGTAVAIYTNMGNQWSIWYQTLLLALPMLVLVYLLEMLLYYGTVLVMWLRRRTSAS